MDFTSSLFLNLITILLHKGDGLSVKLARNVISKYEKEQLKSTLSSSAEFEMYIQIINEIIAGQVAITNVRDIETIIAKFRNSKVVTDNPEVYSRLKTIMTDTSELTDTKFSQICTEISNSVALANANDSCRRIFGMIMNAHGKKNQSVESQKKVLAEIVEQATNMISDIEVANQAGGEAEDDIRVKNVDLSNVDSIKRAITSYKTLNNQARFKTGLQGLNRALGGGWCAGESLMISALSHNGKSTGLLKFARWQVTLNTPPAQFPNPTCVIYSLENESQQNLMILYHELYINMFDKLPDPNATDAEIATLLHSEFMNCGWRLIIQRRLPNEFGFPELKADIESIEREGSTPLMCIIDYMSKMRMSGGGGDDGGSSAAAIGDLYSNVCNYLKSKNCTLVTAHQLNRKAQELTHTLPNGAIKRFDESMLTKSTEPHREIDINLYQHIERDPMGRSFMTYRVGKDRYDQFKKVTNADRYFAYYIDPIFGVRDDIDSEDRSIKNIFTYPVDDDPNATPSNSGNEMDNMSL